MSIPPSDSTVLNPPDSAKLISSSSSSVVGPSTPGPSNAFSFKHATFDQVLDDLSCRFILNLPDEELSSIERVCFQVEQAHWYYEDFVRDANPKFPSLPLKKFSEHLFKACPMLHHWSADHEQAFNQFMAYKTRVPVCGAIMLNPSLDKCVLVKGFKASSGWGFPKGKINQNEKESDCAVREVFEETGYNLASQINDQDYVNIIVREQSITLFMVPDVPEDYEFKTRTRKEISKIEWFKMSDLPSWKKKNQTPGKFYLIAPFISHLKDFVSRKKRERKLELQTQTQVLQGEEAITVSVDMTIPMPRSRKHPHTSSISGSGCGSGGESPSTKESTSSSSGGDGGPKTPSPDQPLDERVEVVGAVASMDDQLRNLLMKMGGGVQLAVSDLKPAVSVPSIPEPVAPLQDSSLALQMSSTSSTSSTTTETQATVTSHVPRAATSAPAPGAAVQSASSIDLKRTRQLALLNSVMEELAPQNPHRTPFPSSNLPSSAYPNSYTGAPARAVSAFLPAFHPQHMGIPNRYPQFDATGRFPDANVGFGHHIPQPHPQSHPRHYHHQHSVSVMQGANGSPSLPLPLPIPPTIPQGEMLYSSGQVAPPRELQPHQNQLLNLLSPRLRARTASQPVRNLPFNETPNLPPVPPFSLHPVASNPSYSPAGPINGRGPPTGLAARPPLPSANPGLLSILNSGMAPATAVAVAAPP